MVAAHPTISALSAALEKHTADGVFDKSCPLDLLAVQVAYLPQLNAALDEVRRAWNKLPIDGCGFSKVGVWQWSEYQRLCGKTSHLTNTRRSNHPTCSSKD